MTAKKQTLSALPLGGVGEIGRNLMVYECNGDMVMVDCGISFPDPGEPGVNVVLPDTRYLREHSKKIKGLCITHAHEDHIGAVAYLWDELNDCKVYVSPFARKVLEDKLQQVGIPPKEAKPRLVTIKAGEKYKVGSFEVEYIPVTHSILEAFAVALFTPHGTLLHTGDYKFDPKPVLGHKADEKRLAELGDEGVLAMFGDSTNIFTPTPAGSETDIIPHLTTLMENAPKRVFFSSFASNTGRLIKASEIAVSTGRKVCYLGRTANKMVEHAKALGYFPKGLANHIVDAEEASKLAKNKIMIFASGTQGEGNAALTRLSNGHVVRGIKIEEDDLVLMSSKMIPGNERPILDVYNRLCALNARVVAEDHDEAIHASGHGGRPEIKRMYQLVRPKIAVPVHGEYAMLQEHAKFAKEQGVKQTFIITNGQKVMLNEDEPHVLGNTFPVGKNYIDGYHILENNPLILKERRKLSYDGVISAALVIDKARKEIKGELSLTTKGLMNDGEEKAILNQAVHHTMQALGAVFPDNRIDDAVRAGEVIRATVGKMVSKERGKKPVVMVNFVEI